MADAFTNQFVVAITLERLDQLDTLRTKLEELKALAAQPIPEMVISTTGAAAGLQTLRTELKQTKKAAQEATGGTGTTPGVARDLKTIQTQAHETTRELNETANAAKRLADNIRKTTSGGGAGNISVPPPAPLSPVAALKKALGNPTAQIPSYFQSSLTPQITATQALLNSMSARLAAAKRAADLLSRTPNPALPQTTPERLPNAGPDLIGSLSLRPGFATRVPTAGPNIIAGLRNLTNPLSSETSKLISSLSELNRPLDPNSFIGKLTSSATPLGASGPVISSIASRLGAGGAPTPGYVPLDAGRGPSAGPDIIAGFGKTGAQRPANAGPNIPGGLQNPSTFAGGGTSTSGLVNGLTASATPINPNSLIGKLTAAAAQNAPPPITSAFAQQLAGPQRSPVVPPNLIPGLTQAANATHLMSLAQFQLNGAVTEGAGAFQAFANKFKQLSFYAIAGTFIFGLAKAFSSATSEVISFEAELSKIQGFFEGRTLTDRLTIERGAIQAAEDYGTALSEVVRVTKFFAQAGYSPAEAIKQTRSALSASLALGISPEDAAQTAIATKAITGGRVSSRDIFERISTIDAQFAVNAEDLNTAVQRVGAFVSQLQPRSQGIVDAMDLVIGATTQIVQTTRVSGSNAANALKFMVARLSSPEVATALQGRFGIKLASNQEGTQFRPLVEILSDVSATFKTLKSENRSIEANQLLTTIAGSRQVGLATALLENFSSALDIATKSSEAYGTLEARQALQLDTVQKQFSRFGTSFLALINSFAENSGILLALKNIARGGASVLDSASKSGIGGTASIVGLGAAAFVGKELFQGLGRVFATVQNGDIKTTSLLRALTGASGNAGGFANALSILKTGVTPQAMDMTKLAAVSGVSITGAEGVGVFGRILGAIESIFGALGPTVLIIGGLTTLAYIVKQLSEFDNITPIKKFTTAQIDQTQFGQDLTETTSKIGLSNQELASRILAARDLAVRDVVAKGQVEQSKLPLGAKPTDLAKLADISYADKVASGKELNRAFRKPFEESITQAFLGALTPEQVKAATGEPFQPKPSDNQISYVQGLLKQALVYEKAPDLSTVQALNQRLTDAFSKLDFKTIVSGLNSAVPTINSKTGEVTGRPDLQGTLVKLFGTLAPNFSDFNVIVNSTGQTMKALDAASQIASGSIGSLGANLDTFFRKFYSTDYGLSQGQVQANKAQLAAGFQQSIAEQNPIIAAALEEARNKNTGSSPGSFASKTILEAINTAINNLYLAGISRTSDAGKQLEDLRKGLSQAGNAFVGRVVKDTEIIATAKDKIAEAITDFATKLSEITAVAPLLKSAGFAIDDTAEKLQVIQSAIRRFGGLPSEITGQKLATELKIAQVAAGTDIRSKGINTTLPAIPEFNAVPGAPDQNPPPEVGEGSGTGTKRQKAILALQQQLGDFNTFLGQLLGNKALIPYASPEDVKLLQKVFEQTAPGVQGIKVDTDSLTRALEIMRNMAEPLFEVQIAFNKINRETAQYYDDLKGAVDLQNRFADIRSASRGRAAVRAGGTDVSTRLSDIFRRRDAAEQKAGADFGKTVTDANNNLTLSRSQLEDVTARATQTFQNAVSDAYDTASVDMLALLTTEKDAILDRTTANIRGLVESGTSGVKEVLKNTDLLFARGRDIKGRDTAKAVIEPIASTIQGNVVDNLLKNLAGPGGLFEGPLAAFFGQNEKQQQQLELLRLQQDATYQGTYDGVTQALADSGIALPGTADNNQKDIAGELSKLTGNKGLGRIFGTGKSSLFSLLTVASPLLAGVGRSRTTSGANTILGQLGLGSFKPNTLGKFVPTSSGQLSDGIPSILQGALSPTGPNSQITKSGLDSLKAIATAKNKAKVAKEQLAQLAGIYGGTLLGGAVSGKGANSYSGEGASIGSAIGGLIPGAGPVGTFLGGIVGGLFGGLFGKGPPKPPRTPEVLDRIERNTRTAATAIENQNRQLFTLDSRLLNVPSSFALTKYRPQDANGAGSTVVNQNTYQFTITGNDPQEIARQVERVVRQDQRLQGTAIPLRVGG